MKITVYGHTSHTARLAEIALFVRQLGASQLHTEIWSGFYDYLRQYSALPANMVCVDAPSADSDMVLTLGGDGAVYADGKERRRQPAYPVRVVDTTAAGDTFTGYFFAGILRGSPPSECLRQANMAAALAVGVSGASTSIPTAADVAAALKKLEPDKNPYPKQAENPHECV